MGTLVFLKEYNQGLRADKADTRLSMLSLLGRSCQAVQYSINIVQYGMPGFEDARSVGFLIETGRVDEREKGHGVKRW